jgi:PST family polysaccharide transporter
MQLLLSLNDVGVSTAIVRWRGDLDEVMPTGVTMILAVSGLLYVGMFLIAPVFARAVSTPSATGVIRLLSLGIVIDGFFAVPSVLITRGFRQDQRMVSDFTVFGVQTAVTLALAASGFGPWSLAWGRLAGNLAGGLTIVAMTHTWARPGFNKAVARHMLHFGIPLTGSSVLVFAMLNLDNIIVGKVLGTVALGLYVLAFNLSSWPVNIVGYSVRRVSLAGFSRLQDDPEALRTSLIRTLALLLAVVVPMCALLSVLAGPLIQFVYGSRWDAAAGALRFLAALGAARVMTDFLSDYLIAVGRPRMVFALQALWVVALIPALTVGAHLHGINGIGMAHGLIAIGLITPAYFLVLHRAGVSLGDLARMLWWPMVGAALASAVALLAVHSFHSAFAEASVGGVAAVATYLAVLYPSRSWLLGATRSPGQAILEESPA